MLSAGSILLNAVKLAFGMYEFLIVARVLLSWFPVDPYNKIVQFITDLTDPFLAKLESFMPAFLLSPLNFTPIVALFLLSFAERLIVSVLVRLLFSVSLP